MKTLKGHTSFETAYINDDYPYGFRLRCKRAVWVETKPGYGQRIVSRTTNPKVPYEKWNKPSAGTYSPVVVLVLNEENHVDHEVLSAYDDEPKALLFKERHGDALDDYQQKIINVIIARDRAGKHITWSVESKAPGEPSQSREDQLAIMRKATAIELAKLKKESK